MDDEAYEILARLRGAERLNRFVEWFTKKYAPRDEHAQFTSDFTQLVGLFHEEIQRPFIYELSERRNATLYETSLKPLSIVFPEKTSSK